ncbi:hypothetical protein [Sphingomonas sp.]|uniref:hypothetical protein n=1 Tax=Sphingomonas sp. TaxID=28214 RepID=UPI003CC579C6
MVIGRLAVPAAASLVALTLSGCDSLTHLFGSAPTAEQTCSSQETYDALNGILSGQAQSAASLLGNYPMAATAASPASMKSVLSYSAPTVDDINRNTGKVTCNALMRVAMQTTLLSDTRGLTPNDFGPDHASFAITYSVQATADQGRPLMTLEDASALSGIAFQASLAALQHNGNAAAQQQQADNVQQVEDSPPDNPDDQQSDQPVQNGMDAPSGDAATPAPSDGDTAPKPPQNVAAGPP